jgi:hypothetical protein
VYPRYEIHVVTTRSQANKHVQDGKGHHGRPRCRDCPLPGAPFKRHQPCHQRNGANEEESPTPRPTFATETQGQQ